MHRKGKLKAHEISAMTNKTATSPAKLPAQSTVNNPSSTSSMEISLPSAEISDDFEGKPKHLKDIDQDQINYGERKSLPEEQSSAPIAIDNAEVGESDGEIDSRSSHIEYQHAERILNEAVVKGKLNREHYNIITNERKEAMVHCLPCKQNIALGKAYKALSNVFAHTRRPHHQRSVSKLNDSALRKRAHGEEVPHIDAKKQRLEAAVLKMEKVYEKVKNEYGINTFHLMKQNETIMCSYCMSRFNIFPARGDLFHNIKCHVDSFEHKKKVAEAKPQRIISSFFKKGS